MKTLRLQKKVSLVHKFLSYKCPFGLTFHMPGSTLKVDGKVLIENGVLIK